MVYKNKEEKKTYHREYMRKRRQGLTNSGEGLTEYPDIIDKLTDPVWRDKLTKLKNAFEASHHPDYSEMCFLGFLELPLVFDLLEVTK